MIEQKSRREALLRLSKITFVGAGVSQLPKDWVSPLVQTVILPAHAQTTTDGCSLATAQGDWTLTPGGAATGAGTLSLSLLSNGTGSIVLAGNPATNITWSVNGLSFSASGTNNIGAGILSGTFDSSCAQMTGSLTQVVGANTSTFPFTGVRL